MSEFDRNVRVRKVKPDGRRTRPDGRSEHSDANSLGQSNAQQ